LLWEHGWSKALEFREVRDFTDATTLIAVLDEWRKQKAGRSWRMGSGYAVPIADRLPDVLDEDPATGLVANELGGTWSEHEGFSDDPTEALAQAFADALEGVQDGR
jgi:hypothetical protein